MVTYIMRSSFSLSFLYSVFLFNDTPWNILEVSVVGVSRVRQVPHISQIAPEVSTEVRSSWELSDDS